MEEFIWWGTFGGLLLLVHATSTSVARLPISPAMLYLAFGVLLGPWCFDWLDLTADNDRVLIEHVCEAGILISLFVTGSNLGSTMRGSHWGASVRLATVAMLLTIGALTTFATMVLNLPLGAALILAAALAPTDPVLAGDVQIADPADRDRLRFGLTGEAGLNDGAAFPFVVLGLGLLGLQDLGQFGWRWLVIDLAWAICGALAIGSAMGLTLGRWLARRNRSDGGTVAPDAFFGLGLMAAAYGVSVGLHTCGFLAVFTAAVALQWSAQHQARGKLDAPATVTTTADTEVMAPIRRFNSDLESFVEFALVVLLGVLWASLQIRPAVAVVALLLFVIIRPIAVYVALAGTSMHRHQRALAAWFGIRGIGSLYYVFYALNQGWRTETASEVLGIVAGVVICSIVVHGVSVTPLMSAYARRLGARGLRRPSR